MNQSDQRAYSYIHHHSILQNGTPHDLIIKVGASGPYQNNIFCITIALWYISGVILFQTPFLFMQPKFQFSNEQQIIDICTVQQNIRRTFYAPNTINTINSQLGPFVCQYLFILGLLKSIIYFGGLIGYLAYTTCLDSYGRRFSLIFTCVCICLGSFFLILSSNFLWIEVGLFLIGIGRTVTRVTILIINQITVYDS